MDRLLRMSAEVFKAAVQARVEEVLGRIAQAVNDAPDGRVIAASEKQVKELMEGLRREVFETALQMRVDETEGAFSPSAGRGGPADAQQGAGRPHEPDAGGPGGVPAATLRRRERAKPHAHRRPAG
jgi:hypothetical protein